MGGYYDAGDNVKYGLPMAFTITTLSWAAIFYQKELQTARELENAQAAIRWGTDYFLKASVTPDTLYVQVSMISSLFIPHLCLDFKVSLIQETLKQKDF